jgi:hypothetical protein
MLHGKPEDRLDGILALQFFNVGTGPASGLKISVELVFVIFRELRLLDIDREQLAVEPLGIALAACDHLGRVRPRCHANKKPLLGSPLCGNASTFKICFQLPVYHVGSRKKRQLAKRPELILPVCRGISCVTKRVRCWCVYNLNLVSTMDERQWNCLDHWLSGDFGNAFRVLCYVLQIDRAKDRDAGIQQYLDILPSVWVSSSRRVVPGQAVDKTNTGPSAEHGIQIDARLTIQPPHGDRFQAGQKAIGFGWSLLLNGGNDNVLSSLMTSPALIEHGECLSDAGGIAQEHLEPAPASAPLFSLHLSQQQFRIGSAVTCRHALLSTPPVVRVHRTGTAFVA